MFPINKLEIYAILVVVIGLAAVGAGLYERHEGRVEGRAEVQVLFDAFKNDVKAAGLKAEADKLARETQDAKRIDDAVATRNDALNRMRVAEAAARTRFSTVRSNPSAPSGSNQVCFTSTAYNAAFQQFSAGLNRFLQATSGYAFEGDSAALSAKTLIQAWPKPSP